MAEYADYHDLPPVRRAPLIGLIGKARAGKDTVAARLRVQHGYVRVAFADPLKQAALAINPIVVPGIPGHFDHYDTWIEEPDQRLQDVVLQYGWEVAKDEIPEVRRFLQHLGESVRSVLGEDIWCDKGMAEADRLERAGVPVVVTDVRYANEAKAIKDRGGVLVRVVRPGTSQPVNAHRSETELDGWSTDYTVENRYDLDHLHWSADLLAAAVQADLGLR